MTDINAADVYRKAAEVIVRDGKTEGLLTDQGGSPEAIKNRKLPVCALGACYRAHWELYGEMPVENLGVTWAYQFKVTEPSRFNGTPRPKWIWAINDRQETSAEDIALLLKRRAEEIEGA